MHKFRVTETIPWEGWRKWTVFADSVEEAKELVKNDGRYSGESLDADTVKYHIKGTKIKQILNYTEQFYP